MQSYNERDKFLRTTMIEKEADIKNEMAKKDVAYVVVGKIPKVGQDFTLGGLKYKVIMANNKKKRFTAKLLPG